MTKTKVINRNGRWVVQVKDNLGKYKQVGSFDDKLDALAHRKLVKEAQKAAAAVQSLSVEKLGENTLSISGTNTTYIAA